MAAHYSGCRRDFIAVVHREGQPLQTLWEHAVAAYGRPGVAAACLDLQDRTGADVNLLLTASWLAAQGRGWRETDIVELERLCAGWRERCVLPLRAVRRALAGDAGAAELYRQVKEAELAAERRQLAMVESWLRERPPPVVSGAADELLRRNLAGYLSRFPGAEGGTLAAALAAAGGS